jgi:hypothetical protein
MWYRQVRLRFLLLTFLILFGGLGSGLHADTIFLKNGQTVTGDIVSQTRNRIDIQTTAGLKRVQKTMVRRVVFSKKESASEAAARRAREAAARKAEAEAARQAEAEAEAVRRAEVESARKAEAEAEAARKSQAEAETAARQAEADRKEREAAEAARVPITSSGALWRSMILPGWGQYYQGRTFAAFGYGGAFVGAAALAGVRIQRVSESPERPGYSGRESEFFGRGFRSRPAVLRSESEFASANLQPAIF